MIRGIFAIFIISGLITSCTQKFIAFIHSIPTLSEDEIPLSIKVLHISTIHQSPLPNHGDVVTVTLHNSSESKSTPSTNKYFADAKYQQDEPLWLACLVVGFQMNGNQIMGTYGRVVALKLDWVLADAAKPPLVFSQRDEAAYPP